MPNTPPIRSRSLVSVPFQNPIAAARRHSTALHSDGTVLATGDNRQGECEVGSWTNLCVPKPSF